MHITATEEEDDDEEGIQRRKKMSNVEAKTEGIWREEKKMNKKLEKRNEKHHLQTHARQDLGYISLKQTNKKLFYDEEKINIKQTEYGKKTP